MRSRRTSTRTPGSPTRGESGRPTRTPPIRVRLRFEPSVAHRVREAVWHRSQELTELPKGRLELAVTVNGIVEIQPWIMSWGGAVEVLEPEALRKAVASSVRQAAERYAG